MFNADELGTACTYFVGASAASTDDPAHSSDDFETLLGVAIDRSFSLSETAANATAKARKPEFEVPADGYDRPEGLGAFAKLEQLKQDPKWIAAIQKHLLLRNTETPKCQACNRIRHACCCCTTNQALIKHADLVRRLSDEDRDNHRIASDTVAWASECLARNGVVCLENVVPPNEIGIALNQFKETWEHIYGNYIKVYQEHYNETVSAKGKLFKEGVILCLCVFICKNHMLHMTTQDWRGVHRYDISYGMDEGIFASQYFKSNPIV